MTIEEIKELLKLFNESGVAEMELQRGDHRLRLRRSSASQEVMVPQVVPHVVPQLVTAPVVPVAIESGHAAIPATSAHMTPHPEHPPEVTMPSARPAEPDSGHYLQKSPIVGTYYDAPAPGAPPFVRVGDSVEPGQVLCIIESMKLMNEIEAEVAGVIAAKLVENGRPVEYGEALISIRPR